jgi:hypothetical protein
MIWFALAAAWISTGAGVVYALHMGHPPTVLWAFLIPGCISVRSNS